MFDNYLPAISQIESLIRDIPGWTPIDQLHTLFTLTLATGGMPGDIVEIGSWCGRSAAVLGIASLMTGGATVHCIDLFPEKEDWKQNQDGSYSFKVKIGDKTYGGYEDQTVWAEPFERDIAPIYARYPGILDVFSETMAKNNLGGVVKSYRGDSSAIGQLGDTRFRLAFLDGDHSYDAVCTDIRNVDARLLKGGWICFDDAFSCYDGVNRAIRDMIVENPSYELAQQMTRKFFIARKKS